MKVLVTGGSGGLGRWVIRELAGHGYELVNADLRPPSAEKNLAHYRETDLTDVGQVAGALHGCEAVVHLGAIPSPGRHPDEVVFATNTRATFAVLQAAALLGVGKAVVASSTAALGTAFALHPFPPRYVPIDEAHPLLPQDPYGLSKEVGERTGEAFHRRTGMSVLAYRFHWITQPGEVAAQAAAFRAQPELRANELWGYVDVRDAARACRLGLEVKGLGFEVFNITAADSLSEVATAELVERYYPGVAFQQPLEGNLSAWSIAKARQLLAYEPRYSWRLAERDVEETP